MIGEAKHRNEEARHNWESRPYMPRHHCLVNKEDKGTVGWPMTETCMWLSLKCALPLRLIPVSVSTGPPCLSPDAHTVCFSVGHTSSSKRFMGRVWRPHVSADAFV